MLVFKAIYIQSPPELLALRKYQIYEMSSVEQQSLYIVFKTSHNVQHPSALCRVNDLDDLINEYIIRKAAVFPSVF